jgi:TetR/AcrR family transcriptional repressor of nem operon
MKEQTTQQRILDAATDLMYAQSYAEVGIAAICEKAGVQKGSFYHFFKSKQELAMAVMEENFADYKAAILDRVFTGKHAPLDELREFIDQIYILQKDIQGHTGHVLGCPFGNLSLERSSQDEEIRLKLEHLFNRSKQHLRDTLQRGVDSYDPELADIDVRATADAMYAYMEGVLLFSKTSNDPEVIRRLAPAMLAIRIYPESH